MAANENAGVAGDVAEGVRQGAGAAAHEAARHPFRTVFATAMGYVFLANVREITGFIGQLLQLFYVQGIGGAGQNLATAFRNHFIARHAEIRRAARRFFLIWIGLLVLVSGIGSAGYYLGGTWRKVLHGIATPLGIATWVWAIYTLILPLSLVMLAAIAATGLVDAAQTGPVWLVSAIRSYLIRQGAVAAEGGQFKIVDTEKYRVAVRNLVLDIFIVVATITTTAMILKALILLLGVMMIFITSATMIAIASRRGWSFDFGYKMIYKFMISLMLIVIVGSILRFLMPDTLDFLATAQYAMDARMLAMVSHGGTTGCIQSAIDMVTGNWVVNAGGLLADGSVSPLAQTVHLALADRIMLGFELFFFWGFLVLGLGLLVRYKILKYQPQHQEVAEIRKQREIANEYYGIKPAESKSPWKVVLTVLGVLAGIALVIAIGVSVNSCAVAAKKIAAHAPSASVTAPATTTPAPTVATKGTTGTPTSRGGYTPVRTTKKSSDNAGVRRIDEAWQKYPKEY